MIATPDPIDPEPDPATPARRKELARSMIVSAIHDYEAASHRWSVVHQAYPLLTVPSMPGDPDEHRAWVRLLGQADDDFNSAELALATRIQVLHDDLAGPARRTTDIESPYFVPTAVRHQGSVYCLAYSVNEHDVKTNIISVHREVMTLDLDAD